jgi:hypothetical protein
MYQLRPGLLKICSNLHLFNLSTGGETRTPDPWFWRPMLYQLSYTRVLYLRKHAKSPIPQIGTEPWTFIENSSYGLLFNNFRYLTGAYGTSTFTDGKPESLVNSNRIDQLNSNGNIVTGHNHFTSFG